MTYSRDFAQQPGAPSLHITEAADQLRALGVRPGDVLMIHASMRKVGRIEGGVDGLIDALAMAVGPAGTLMAYADFEPTEAVPYFDLERSPCAADHGVFAEALRQREGTLRSTNPGASVVANGAAAMGLVAPHPLRYGYGRGTPFERFVAAGGKVLLLGSDFDHVTILHHAEALADLPDKRIVRNEVRVRTGDEITSVQIEEFNTSIAVVAAMPDSIFDDIVSAYVATREVGSGMVGGAQTFLLEAADLVAYAIAWMEREYGRGAGE
ncbi:MAG TPA: AAC(3) family N-acetyltransferase [Longimicrobiaceae bacterium]|nr:AAC(3) family N-acetyltransferase [Longimicrobiaceae bacterium]